MGKKPSSKHSIERIDNDGNYEPGNCRWATRKEQANNTSRNIFLSFNGERLTISQWVEKTGIKEGTMRNRVRAGWPVAMVLSKTFYTKKTARFKGETA